MEAQDAKIERLRAELLEAEQERDRMVVVMQSGATKTQDGDRNECGHRLTANNPMPQME